MKTSPLDSLLKIPSPTQQIVIPDNQGRSFTIDVKREDLIHPTLSGNKYRKLQGHLSKVIDSDLKGVVTMGGPWSNHIHSCSWLCQLLEIPCVLLIRGPEPAHYSATLTDALNCGAQIEFVSRQQYRELRQGYETQNVADCLLPWSDYYFIPEGGRHVESGQGLQALAKELEHSYDAVYMAVGTGTTMAGLINCWTNPSTHFHGVLAVDARESQTQTIEFIADAVSNRYTLRDEFLFGGYANTTNHLNQFIRQSFSRNEIPLEPVYTAKAFYGLVADIQADLYHNDSRILFIHTGGLQGIRGFSDESLAKVGSYYESLENLPFKGH